MYLLPLRPRLTKLLAPDSEELKLCQTGPNNCEEVQQMQSQTGNNSETVAGTSSGGGIMPRRSVPGAEHSALDRLPSAWPQSAAAAPNNIPSPVSTWATSGDNPAPDLGRTLILSLHQNLPNHPWQMVRDHLRRLGLRPQLHQHPVIQ
jgi:hypothetical protein